MYNTSKLTNAELRTLINSRIKNEDLTRCAEIFEHSYNYLAQVKMGHRENRKMLEDLLTTISNREQMERMMINRRKKQLAS